MSTKIVKIESYNDSNDPAYIETKLSVEKLTILIRCIIGTLIDQDEKGEVVGVSLCLREMLYFLIPSKKLDVADDYEVLDVRDLFDLDNTSDAFWHHYQQFGIGVTHDDIFAAYDRVHAIYYPRCSSSKPCAYCLKAGYIPNWLSHLKYQLACDVSDGKAKTWCTDFWEAIGVGVDIDKVERLDELKYRFLEVVINRLETRIDFPGRIERSEINPEISDCMKRLREATVSRASKEQFSAIASHAEVIEGGALKRRSSYLGDTPWRTASVIKFIAEELTESDFLPNLIWKMADLAETRSRDSATDNPYTWPSKDDLEWAYISEIDELADALLNLLEET